MARKCQITNKKTAFGNNKSFSNRKTRRPFRPNIIKTTLLDPKTGKRVRVKIAASTKRTLDKQERMAKKAAASLLK